MDPHAKINPNEKFHYLFKKVEELEASLTEVRSRLILLEGRAPKSERIKHRGWGRFDVINDEGLVINDKPLTKAEAEEMARGL